MSGCGWFVTGTDTDVGKTYVSVRLLEALAAAGRRVVGMKPVASGAQWQDGRLVNADALALMQAASVKMPYEWVNPFVFGPPIAPHLAAAQAGVEIELGRVEVCFRQLSAHADCVVVEGAGGWRVPLNQDEDMASLAGRLGLPVLMVVGLRLGCINHACLTAESIRHSGLRFGGWIANTPSDGVDEAEQIVATLTDRLALPPLAVLGYRPLAEGPLSDPKDLFKCDEILRLMRP